ncbi:M56 family metallopeptidase [Pedobacter puniceum]|uniref:TonB family protein n=1 Tax=Pedobacter puniceum TaxID=2666136 RepID=A0A7K0FR29_9SPHI|nr:M56 family metallopeptidase [Pedobacter puniceum]MRX47760.1 TonB family protein [Pedobacter puniceum]
MMNWANYLIQINIYLMLFYGFYFLFLRNETFFQLNRIYLVGSALISLCIPLFYLDWIRQFFITDKVEQGWSGVYIAVTEGFAKPINTQAHTLSDYVTFIYIGGVLVCFTRLVYRLVKLRRLLKTDNHQQAFSFFNQIKIDENLPQKDIILKHELTHAKQLHTADVLFFEIISIINWFNPIVYFYKVAIKQIHEFIADEVVVQSASSKKEYALLLFSESLGINPHKLTNTFFNQSLLKRRILMLQKQKSSKAAILKYGLSVPLFLLALILSSATINENKTLKNVASKIEFQESIQTLIPTFKETTLYKIKTEQLKPKSETIVDFDETEASFNRDTIKKELTKEPALDAPILKEVKVYGYKNEEVVSNDVDVLPMFKGGPQKFPEFLMKNLQYPIEAKEKKIEGRVIVNFIVEKDGSLSDIKILRGVSKELDEEALRVIKLSPNWEPGQQNGKVVRVNFALPISFNLTGYTPKPQFILDGKVITEEDMKKIKPENIDKVEVLKDKNATDKYGEQGKNGVVVITLKEKQ